MDPCSLPVDAVVGGVGMHSYPVLLIPLLHCLLVFNYSGLQCSLCLSDVYLTAVLAGNLVDYFLLLFKHLLLHFHQQLLQCTLGLEDSFHPKACTGLLNLLTEGMHIRDVERLLVAPLLRVAVHVFAVFGGLLTVFLISFSRKPFALNTFSKLFHLWLLAGVVTDTEGSVTHASHHSC